MKTDPVCKMKVEEEKAVAKSVYKDQTFYFCSAVCKDKFDKEPEKHLKEEK